jgi:hypothetical protein
MADTKNFGLVGVGTQVQFGKAGPKFVANSGHFEAVTATGSLTNVKGKDAVALNDLVTLSQLQQVQSNASTAIGNVDGFDLNLGDVSSKGDGSWQPGAIALTNTTKVSDAVDSLNEVLAKLIPSQPPQFPNGAISINNATGNTPLLAAGGVPDNSTTSPYAAGQSVTRIVNNPTTNTLNDVGPGDSGTISLLLNGAVVGSKTLTGSGDAGTFGGLQISDQKDYPVSTPGFWKSIDVAVAGPTSSNGVNKIKLTDTAASASNEIYFVKDGMTAVPAVTLATVAQSTLGTVSYSSGVPHYNAGGTLTLGLSVANLSGETYYGGSDPLVVSGSNGIIGAQSYTYGAQGITTPIARNTTAATAITPVTVNVNGSNVFAVGTLSATAKNVNGSGAAGLATNVLVMAGTQAGKVYEMNVPVSGLGALPNNNNAVRVNTANGDTPAAAATTFDPSVALATYEAAVVAGVLRADQTNYSVGYLPAGPNLSTQAGVQYVTFSFNRSAVSKFSIVVAGNYAGCQIKLPGVSDNSSISPSGSDANGWWNMYLPYDGAGVPGEAGDPTTGCALGTVMSGNGGTFVGTFGTQSSTNSTGNQILVRFKLNAGQSITSLSFTN